MAKSNLYPEENILFDRAGDSLSHALGQDLADKAVNVVIENVSRTLTVSELVTAVQKYKPQLAATLKAQCAKHNPDFNAKKDEWILAAVIALDIKKIHSLPDVDRCIADRILASDQREKDIMQVRKAARDAINGDNKYFNGPGSWGNYSDEELSKLSDRSHERLIDSLNKHYKTEIDRAKSLFSGKAQHSLPGGDDSEGFHQLIISIENVHRAGVGGGEAFHKAIIEDLEKRSGKAGAKDPIEWAQRNANPQQTPAVVDDDAMLRKAGINSADHQQVLAINHAVCLGGDKNYCMQPKDLIPKNASYIKAQALQFLRDFHSEVAMAGGNASQVIDAVRAVYFDPQGENGGKNPMNSRQYHSAVTAELKKQLGITSELPGQEPGYLQAAKNIPAAGFAVAAADSGQLQTPLVGTPQQGKQIDPEQLGGKRA